MKDLDKLLSLLCKRVQTLTKKKCYSFSGYKNEGYWRPLMRIGNITHYNGLVWFVEIWYDEICIFREMTEKRKGKDDATELMLLKIFISAFEWSLGIIKKHNK